MTERRETRPVFKGSVQVGGGAPVSVQSMTDTHTEDVATTVRQIRELEALGCEIIRVAVPSVEAARAIADIRPELSIPLVADVHFDHRLALESIRRGADCVRINPGNLRDRDAVAEVARTAGNAGVSIRIGVNSGSIRERHGLEIADHRPDLAALMVEAARDDCAFIESLGFRDLVVSLKASDVPTTLAANRAFAAETDIPLHLGITEAGTPKAGTVKSAVGIGALLAEGIGDTIRVSLTGPPHDEVRVGRAILRALGLREGGIEVLSCPTCGRCEIDLAKLVRDVRARLPETDRPLTVAVMGCVVNGPGEAAEADIGIAGGKGFGFLFRGGKKLRKVPEEQLADELIEEIRALLGGH
jgi:(E)-4-hydroxy-3-methylbut-2-enyl-diphosphate synthase